MVLTDSTDEDIICSRLIGRKTDTYVDPVCSRSNTISAEHVSVVDINALARAESLSGELLQGEDGVPTRPIPIPNLEDTSTHLPTYEPPGSTIHDPSLQPEEGDFLQHELIDATTSYRHQSPRSPRDHSTALRASRLLRIATGNQTANQMGYGEYQPDLSRITPLHSSLLFLSPEAESRSKDSHKSHESNTAGHAFRAMSDFQTSSTPVLSTGYSMNTAKGVGIDASSVPPPSSMASHSAIPLEKPQPSAPSVFRGSSRKRRLGTASNMIKRPLEFFTPAPPLQCSATDDGPQRLDYPPNLSTMLDRLSEMLQPISKAASSSSLLAPPPSRPMTTSY
ncbi:hypothetical protein DACRYDRAFT_117144 [Dacryopinax primogenitus]|uniref:Uncharacterized protein n=1 Tax=Dacryopinax primogenitus (strain DJM 731) TaxID=1858805 RepID=M5GA34_DACPD|nr:uncharacterized protein DACRYDRAFT_117144 [Dacryopinax primogenitus]EJU00713.1 hypothetical protein DACRYDRAFT_117144 [Dacryopinax primogenitus]